MLSPGEVFGCDYTDLEAVKRLAAKMSRNGPYGNNLQIVIQRKGSASYNITRQVERAMDCLKQGGKIITWFGDELSCAVLG